MSETIKGNVKFCNALTNRRFKQNVRKRSSYSEISAQSIFICIHSVAKGKDYKIQWRILKVKVRVLQLPGTK